MDSKIGFEMSLIIVEAIRGRCASFMILVATVSEIFGGQTTPSILAVTFYRLALFVNLYRVYFFFLFVHGSYRSWKTWKVMEFDNLDSRPGKSLCKFIMML